MRLRLTFSSKISFEVVAMRAYGNGNMESLHPMEFKVRLNEDYLGHFHGSLFKLENTVNDIKQFRHKF